MSVRDEARYQPGDSVGTIGNDRVYHGGVLNIDGDFQVRQNISFANTMLDQHTTTQLDIDSFRQQFDSLPKDFLSKEQLHIDMVHFSRACNSEVPLNKNGGSYSVNIGW